MWGLACGAVLLGKRSAHLPGGSSLGLGFGNYPSHCSLPYRTQRLPRGFVVNGLWSCRKVSMSFHVDNLMLDSLVNMFKLLVDNDG